ncbi:hypothetical protein A9Q99_25340 [Gammaproteobacteria bacterium 45_16_T64]|nr:hypothetical protein A9Q99_25340 [Gammaproteobacteria bacterium 45_16_T64]
MCRLNKEYNETLSGKGPIKVIVQTHTTAIDVLLRYVLQSSEEITLLPCASIEPHRLPNGEGVLVSEYEPGAARVQFKKEQKIRWPRLLIGSALPSEEEVSVFQSGEAGYLSLPNQLPFLVKSISEIANGGLWFSRDILYRVQKLLEYESDTEQPSCGSELIKMLLTRREYMVKQSVCLGLRNKEVADRLSISEKTVKLHLNRIFKKLSITSRGELMALDHDPQGLSRLSS